MTLHIGLLLFPRLQQLDMTGPYDVFAHMPDVKVHLVWKRREPVKSSARFENRSANRPGLASS